ncbi:MAG TPA: hypothetical protein VFS43_47555 [Polyangiaceae bacterium]|nr:hypothetical protein [Polyangiaceae bacterium]
MSRDERDAPEAPPPSPRAAGEGGAGEERANEPGEGQKGARKKGPSKKRSGKKRADGPGVGEAGVGEAGVGEADAVEPAADEPSATEESAGEPARRKRVRRGASASAADPSWPPFAADYPDDPALVELVRAFQAGDYGRVRREAPALAERGGDPEVARAARDLRARLDPDSLTLGIFIGTGLLLALLTAWAYGHGH